MNLTHHHKRHTAGVLQVLLISTALLASGLVWAGFAVVKSLRPSGALPDLGADLFEELNLTASTQIQVKAPPLLFTAARWASHLVDIDPEVRCGLRAVRSAQVGVYELTKNPERRTQLDLIRLADERLLSDGYERLLCVLDGGEMVLVYLSATDDAEDMVEGCVVVLAESNLVLTSVCIQTDAITDLVELASGRIDLELAQMNHSPPFGNFAR